jgi:hypothetical protein
MAPKFSQFDVFPKTLQEFRHRTQTGAVVSIVCAVLIALLTMVELSDFIRVPHCLHCWPFQPSRGCGATITLSRVGHCFAG